MEKLIDEVKINWRNPEALKKILLDIVSEYWEQAQRLANAVLSEASTFNAEMEDNFKPSVTKAEYRAKELVGNTKVLAEREMKALELLYDVVKTAIMSSHTKKGL